MMEEIANNYFKTNIPLQIPLQEEVQFQQSEVCWSWEEPFSQDKKRDHDHLAGHYRGAAHNKCF